MPLLLVSFLLWMAPQVAEPVVSWTSATEFNFGEIRLGGTREHVFSFKNTGSEPVILQTVRTTCGCTAASWTEEPILSGASGDIKIEYDATKTGSFRKKIRVFFDRQKKPEILWVEGEVVN